MSQPRSQTKADLQDCIEFTVKKLAVLLPQLERIESLPIPEDRKDSDGCLVYGSGAAFALGQVQSIAFNIRVDLEFVKAELESCLSGRPK